MPKKRLISHKMMAVVCVTGGAISLAVTAGSWALGPEADRASVLGQIVVTAGVIAWFLGMAAGVLTVSTRYARWGALGLTLGGITAVAVLAAGLLQAT